MSKFSRRSRIFCCHVFKGRAAIRTKGHVLRRRGKFRCVGHRESNPQNEEGLRPNQEREICLPIFISFLRNSFRLTNTLKGFKLLEARWPAVSIFPKFKREKEKNATIVKGWPGRTADYKILIWRRIIP